MTDEETYRKFPSLKPENKIPAPRGWIQWKGTNVCVDIHCACGEMTHFDGTFMYHIKCPHCGQVYECAGHIKLHPIDFEPDGTKLADAGDDREVPPAGSR